MIKQLTNHLLLLALVTLLQCPSAVAADLELIQPNDNITPAGSMQRGELRLNLVAERGMWHPETIDNPGIEVHAFREAGKPLSTPGPLVRIPQDTKVTVSIHNAIANTTLEVRGFQPRPSAEERVLVVPFGATQTVTFTAGLPGTYFYWATTDAPFNQRDGIDSQLSGAFIVDEPGNDVSADRVFVLGEWKEHGSAPPPAHTAYTINGQAWPHTPRIETTVGEHLEWRWINPSRGGHPLHLHGSFYNVVEKGDLLQNVAYATADQRTVVTELLSSGTTMKMRWSPEYEGNWLLHCHISAHVSPATRLAPPSQGGHNHAEEGMSGMVIGIHAAPTSDMATHPRTDTRHITMDLQRQSGYYDNEPGFAVAFDEQPTSVPGKPLFLTRGQTVDIEIVNHLGESTSIHWHGMELESYYDGVAGFSGTQRSVTPSIGSGESFHAIFTPPRAGTFIYHSHMDDERQLAAGLYGAMIISEPTEPFDTEIDKLFVIGLLGFDVPEAIGFNGEAEYQTRLKAGRDYRLRIINITASNGGFNVTLTSPAEAVTWHPVAEDGANLPLMHRKSRPAMRQDVSVGETFDFMWNPNPGIYWMEVRRFTGEWMAQARIVVEP